MKMGAKKRAEVRGAPEWMAKAINAQCCVVALEGANRKRVIAACLRVTDARRIVAALNASARKRESAKVAHAHPVK